MTKESLPEPDSEKELRSRIAAGLASLDEYLELARLVYLTGRYPEAVTWYQTILGLPQPLLHRARVCQEFGQMHFDMNDQAQASRLAEEAIGILSQESECPEVWARRGVSQTLIAYCEWSSDQQAGARIAQLALENLDRAIGENSGFQDRPLALLNTATLHGFLGNSERAITFVEQAMQYDLHGWQRLCCVALYGESLLTTGRCSEAQRQLQIAIDLARPYKTLLPLLYRNLALTERLLTPSREKQQLRKAQFSCHEALVALAADPYRHVKSELNRDINMNLAWVCYELEEFPAAATAFEEALQDMPKGDPSYSQAQLWLGGCYQNMANYAKAQLCYKNVLTSSCASDEQKLDAKLGLAHGQFALGNKKGAMVSFQELVTSYPQHDPRRFNVILWIGHCHGNLRNYTEAQNFYEEVMVSPHASKADKLSARQALDQLSPASKRIFH
jgi:tetratricopeptide (TPR) repeat protein